MNRFDKLYWAEYFLDIAEAVSKKSKDPSTKVGAVIVAPDKSIRSTGFNGLPRGVEDLKDRMERPSKYLYTAHAEQNAICQAAKSGTHTDGCTIYISSLPPCSTCARMIIQSGIKEVVLRECNSINLPARWKDDMQIAEVMLKEADITICVVP